MPRKPRPGFKPHEAKKASARVTETDDAIALFADHVRGLVLSKSHPWQRMGVEDPATRISMLVGRGGTKTTTMAFRNLIKLSSIKQGLLVYVTDSRPHAEELMWGPIKNWCDYYGIMEHFSFLDGKLRMTCKLTGATLRLFGVEDKRDADKLRGQPFDEVQFDEVGSMDPELVDYAIEQCVAPRIGERNGTIVIGSTPPPRLAGVFYDATRLGAVDDDGQPLHRPYADRDRPEFANWLRWSSHQWTLKQVYELPDARNLYPALVANWEEALRNKARKKWSDDHPVWLREWLGQWASDYTSRVFRYRPHVDDKPWNQWNPFGSQPLEGLAGLRAAIDALPKDVGTWHHAVAMDTGGTRDPFACNVFSFAPADPEKRMIHTFCFEAMGFHARPIAELLLGSDPGSHPGVVTGGLFQVLGWPDTVDIDSDANTIAELANVYGVQAKKFDRRADYKFGAVELTNGDLVDGRIKILKGSLLEKQIQTLQWRADEYGMMKEDKAQANHSTDCLLMARLAIAKLFDTGTVSDEKAQPKQHDFPLPAEIRHEGHLSELESLLLGDESDDSLSL